MSLRATSWAWEIPTSEIGMTNKFVLLALADYADKDGLCFPSQATLGDKVALSERTIRTCLADLETKGLISRTPRSSTEGRRSDLIQLELPESCNRKDLPVAQPEVGDTCNRQKAPTPTGNQLPVATKGVINQSDITPQSALAEEVYKAYPRKTARPTAIKAILRAMKQVPFEDLLRLTKDYAEAVRRSGAELRFIPHPATWYNQERWADDRREWTAQSAKPGSAPAATRSRPLTFEEATAHLPHIHRGPRPGLDGSYE